MTFARRDGQFLVRDIIPGRYAVEVAAASLTSEVVPHDLRIEIAPGQSIHNFDITTTKGRAFEGVVTNADAEPLEGVDVRIHVRRAARDGRHVSPEMPSTKTEKDGYWNIENVPDGNVVNVSFSLAGYNSHISATENDGSLKSPVNAMLEPLNEVTLRVIDATTKAPVPHYTYTFFKPGQGIRDGGFENNPRTVVHNPQGMSASWQQAKGIIALLVFELDEAGVRTGRTTFRQLDIGSGGEEQILDVVIGHRVTGRVLRAMSSPPHPIEGARITVGTFTQINHGLPIRKNPDIEDVLTGPDGTFTIELGPGLWELIASKGEHFSTKVMTVYVENDPVNLETPIELIALSAFAE